jgi:hypothetical protein
MAYIWDSDPKGKDYLVIAAVSKEEAIRYMKKNFNWNVWVYEGVENRAVNTTRVHRLGLYKFGRLPE